MLTQNEMKNKIKKIIDLEYLFEKINRLSRNKTLTHYDERNLSEILESIFGLFFTFSNEMFFHKNNDFHKKILSIKELIQKVTDLKKNLNNNNNNNNNNLDALNSMLNNIFHLLNQIWNLEDDEILTNQNGNWNYYNKDWNENNINNHNYLYNQNLQNQFNSYINNIIFYDPVNSGRKMQLEYNINYYNKNNPENKIAYEFFDDISELTEVNLWGSETEFVKNAADRLLRKYGDINIDKYYAIIKNISYYKFFGNDSHKLSNSPFDSISKFNIVNKKVRIILLENDETIEDFKTSKSYKNNKTWKFITGIMHNNDNLNIMNKLINDQISITHNVNSNYSINNETVNIINLTNNSLFNNNKNPITSAYEFIISQLSTNKNNDIKTLQYNNGIDNLIIIDKMIDQLNLLIYHIEKNFEIYKILWFKSFKEAFENKESSDFFDEFKKFNKREGGLFTKYIDISKTISEVLDAYREYHPNYEENSTFKLNCLIEKELCEGTIENCECKKTSDFAKLLEYIQNIFKLSKKYGKKLIFNYFSHNVDLKENKFNVLYNNDINHKNYYDELKNEIINDKNISKIELDELRYCFLYSDFNANKNYYKIKFPDRTMLKSFLFIGLDFSLIEKVTIDVILKSFFTNLEITNKNLTTDKNNYIKYIKSELNNIVFPFEKDLKTNDYQTLIQNIKSLNGFLKSEIIGQNKQIDLITKPIPNRYVLNQEIKKPWRSYLFAGPTGVGKTKTAELIAEKLFSKDKFLILNMSEYADEIKSLIDQNGTLSKQLSNNPQSIVLFDEIEKASQKTIDILLQILSTGTYVDNMGSEISLKNSIVICTTNLNSTLFEYKRLINKPNEWLKSAKLKFREEILGRFDDIILFNEISNDVVYEIFCKKLNDQLSKISASYKNEIDFIFDHKSFKRVVKKIIESGFGVRKIESFIDINILSTISNVILEMDLNKKIIITLKYEKNKVIAKGEYNEK